MINIPNVTKYVVYLQIKKSKSKNPYGAVGQSCLASHTEGHYIAFIFLLYVIYSNLNMYHDPKSNGSKLKSPKFALCQDTWLLFLEVNYFVIIC